MLPRTLDNGLKIFCLFFVTSIAARSQNDKLLNRLSELLASLPDGRSKPVVMVLNPSQSGYSDSSASSNDDSRSTDDLTFSPSQKEQDSYMLYGILRTKQDAGEIDSSVEKEVNNAQRVLRTALRSRCSKLQSCVQNCDYRRRAYCEHNCQKVFDSLNLCEPPTTTCRTTCRTTPQCGGKGKTMPPKWLRMLRMLGLQN